MAAAASQKSTTSLSLYGLEVEEELSTLPLGTGQKESGRENGITSKEKLG